MERLVLVRVTLGDDLGDFLSDRASPRSIAVLPRQSIVLARCADDLLRVLIDLRAVVLVARVLDFGFDESLAHVDGIELVPADAAEQDFARAGLRIEVPLG